MTVDQLISTYTPGGDATTAVACVILLFVINKTLSLSNGRRFEFLKRAMHFVLFASISNVAFYVVVRYWKTATVAIFLLRDIYHFCLLCCLYCFLLYMKRMVAVEDKLIKVATYATRIIFLVCLVMDLLSPITHLGLSVVDGKWSDPMLSMHNVFYMYAIIVLFFMLVLYSKRIIKLVRTCLIYTEIVILVVMFAQFNLNTNTYSTITYLMPILVVLITLHSKPYDVKSGSLSVDSFDNFLKGCSRRGESVDYLVLKLYMSIIEQIPDELGKALNSFWLDSFKEASLFELSNDLFVLAIPRNEKNTNTQEEIERLVNVDFAQYYDQYQISYKILELFDIDFIDSMVGIRGILNYLLSQTEENTVFVSNDKTKEQLKFYRFLKLQLEDIEKNGDLDDPRVLAYCQPIRNMKTGKFDTAEALMRLELPGYGIVMPYMFVELAEAYNHIHALTKVMLNKVCKQIKCLEEEGYDFNRISVNIAASEIKMDGFCEEIIDIIKSNGISTSRIGIEITESQNESDFLIVKQKLQTLHNAGLTIYLDDIGTGYSNLDRIVQYDVDVVKFDRFFLLEAENSVKVVKMMSHLAQAFRDLDYKLLYEGVETDAHEALCLNCYADYIQGFKYSKPLPIEEMRNFFERGGTAKIDINDVVENPDLIPREKEDYSLKEIRDQYHILITMSQLFYSMHVIDLVNNTATPYNPTEDVKVVNVVNSSMGANEMMAQIMRMCTEDEYIEDALKFSDLTTIADRMKGKKVYQSDVYVGRSIGPYIAAFFTIEKDSDDRPTKVVYTTRSVDAL